MSRISITATVVAAGLGVLAWGSGIPGWAQGGAILMPVLWASAESRWSAGLVVMAYTTAASRGLIPGIAEFFGTNLAHGLALWLAAGLLPFVAGAVCRHRASGCRVVMVPVLLLVLILPPVGLVGWANPITAAGWLFPGWSWWGLLAAVALSMALSWKRPLMHAGLAIVPILALSAALDAPAKMPNGWEGHNTAFRFGVGAVIDRDPMDELRRHWTLQTQVAAGTGPVHVLPETVGGTWNSHASDEWRRFLADLSPGQIVLMGTYEPADGSNYNNALVEIAAEGSRIAYRQRSPIPVGMWTPWNDTGAVAHWLTDGAVELAGRRAAVMMCYEALLVWPVLHSVLERPELFVSTASTWWAPESIHLSQRHAMQSWARLFNIPLTEAYNL